MKNELQINIQEFARRHQLFTENDLLIVAISGGVDSVVLAHTLSASGQQLVLAHCNFHLRADESERDEIFVRQFAAAYGLTLYVERFDTAAYALVNKLSTQVAARRLRYTYFEKLRQQLSVDGKRVLIATGHHANDATETLLFNLFRGTGIDGLRGIPVKNGSIIRPMLFAKRTMIEAYAGENRLSWVEDSSNAGDDYTRNYIRHAILPAVESQFPQVTDNLTKTMDRLKEVAEIYHEVVAVKLQKMVEVDGNVQKLPILKLAKCPQVNTLIWEWIKPFGFTEGQIDEVKKLFEATNGSITSSATHKLIRDRAWLILTPNFEPHTGIHAIETLPANVILPGDRVVKIGSPEAFQEGEAIPALPNQEAIVNGDLLKLPLVIRARKPGDYFYPLGMQKKKKIARFLIDQKLSPLEKEQVWVLESDKRIVWVIGYRIDDRFRLKPGTSQKVSLKISTI